MPFPQCKIKLVTGFGTSRRIKYVTDEVTGISVPVVQDCNKPLPSPEMFKIKNQLAAGVTLNEVPTKVVSNVNPSVIEQEVADVAVKVRKSNKKNKEVTNEDA